MAQHITNNFNGLTQASGPSPKIVAHEKPRADNDLAGLWPNPLSCLSFSPIFYPLKTEKHAHRSREKRIAKFLAKMEEKALAVFLENSIPPVIAMGMNISRLDQLQNLASGHYEANLSR